MKKILLSLGLVSALVISACGGGGGSPAASNTNTITNTGTGTGTVISTTSIPANLMGGAIQKTLNLTGAVSTFAGKAGVAGSTDGIGSSARFFEPSWITTDGLNLYETEVNSKTVRKIDIATGAVTTIAGKSHTDGSTDGVGMAALFEAPLGITTDGTNLYVADASSGRSGQIGATIRKVAIATGVVTTLAGSATAIGSTDGIGTAALFNRPVGITTDGTILYVVDSGNATIRKVVIATGVVTTLAGTAGVQGSADGTGAAALFYFPSGITTDGTNLYVTGNSIRKVVIATGVVTTVAGRAGVGVYGSTDGTGMAALFYLPTGITTDGTNLYVADNYNNTIRKVVIATGVVTTLAGSARVSGSTDGIGSAANFYWPGGITTDGTSLYVADSGNSIIRKIQ